MVLFLQRAEYYNRAHLPLAGKGKLIVAKARKGALGKVRLHYDARTCRSFE